MKTKAFTLIEILIATLIFMTVVVISVAAFAAVKRSNEISSDSSKTNECSTEIENFAGAIFRTASFGNPRIMAIVDEGGSIVMRDLSKISGEETEAMGFAVFEQVTNQSRMSLSAIFKNIDTENQKLTGYYYKSGEFDRSEIRDRMTLANFINFTGADTDPQRIHSSGCIPLHKNLEGFAGNYKAPFRLKLSYPDELGPASQIGNPIYMIEINDLIYSSFSTQDVEDRSIAKLYLMATNNIKPI